MEDMKAALNLTKRITPFPDDEEGYRYLAIYSWGFLLEREREALMLALRQTLLETRSESVSV